MATEISTDSLPCKVCKFPIPAPTYIGEEVKCAYCGSINKAIRVQIPTPLFAFVLGFVGGAILGPAFWQATKSGSEWLGRKAKERIG